MNTTGWWGEGELKFYLDDDADYPTICGTGTEDYFGGAWNFDVPGRGYTEFSTPVSRHAPGDPAGRSLRRQQRFGLYRWHVLDPIHFASGLRRRRSRRSAGVGGRYRRSRTTSPRRRSSTSIGRAPSGPACRTSTHCGLTSDARLTSFISRTGG